MAINKKLIHFKLKSTFESELEAGNILDTSIVFIQDANLIWTHGTYYCLPKDEILISEGTEPTDGQEIWIDLSEDSTVFAVEEAPKDGKQYVRENGKWVEIPITDLSNYLAKDNTEEYTPTDDYNPTTKKYVDESIKSNSNLYYCGQSEVLDIRNISYPNNYGNGGDYDDILVEFLNTDNTSESNKKKLRYMKDLNGVDIYLISGDSTDTGGVYTAFGTDGYYPFLLNIDVDYTRNLIINVKKYYAGKLEFDKYATKEYVDDNKGVEEAPNDGKAYIRKNESWVEHQEQEVYVGTTEPSIDCDIWINPEDGTMKYKKEDGSWEEIAGGGGIGEITETVKVSLTSNQSNPNSDLTGVEITVEYSGLTKKANWEGSELTFNIPHSTEYTIKAAAVEGYSTPADQSFTAVMGETRNVSVVYNTTIVTVNKACNQTSGLGASCTAVVKYDSTQKTLSFNNADTSKTIKIPTGKSYTITFSAVEGYKTPEVISQQASGASQSVTGTYKAEVVTITVTTSDSTSANGQKVTVTISSTPTEYTWNGEAIVLKIPFDSSYSVAANQKANYSTPATQSYTADRVNRDITLNYVYAPAIGTIFKDSDGANTLEQNGGTDTSWIKGKRCLVKKTSSGVAICYLDENNSELFHDGTTAASLDGSMGQWMTDVPEYYFNVDESTSGVHALQVSQFQQDGWKQSRRVLVGVTEAVSVSNKLWSKKGGQSTGSLTSVVFHNYATALGSGFDIIDYETHCKIAHLFYAKYANRNPQEMSQFGYGENSYTRTIGTTSSLGNNDGKTSTQISFLGIEDFYGGKYEWMSGIHSNGSIYYIYDGFEPDAVPTASYRTVDVGGSARSGYISKVYWGEHGDMIPTEVSASSTTHYCDWGYVAYSGWRVAMRSASSAYDYGGVAYFSAYYDSGYSFADVGSRIQYRGSIQVIEDPAEFKSLPVGF